MIKNLLGALALFAGAFMLFGAYSEYKRCEEMKRRLNHLSTLPQTPPPQTQAQGLNFRQSTLSPEDMLWLEMSGNMFCSK